MQKTLERLPVYCGCCQIRVLSLFSILLAAISCCLILQVEMQLKHTDNQV